MLNDLKRAVCRANRELTAHRLAKFDWGTVSAFDMSMGLYVIKPRGVAFEDLQPEQMVVMSMDGQRVEGRLEPALDSELHRAMYCAWPLQVTAIVNTRSLYATAYAQASCAIPMLGAEHSRCFGAEIPITEKLVADGEYGQGEAITRAVPDPETLKAALVCGHGGVTWGKSCQEAVRHAVELETIAQMAYLTMQINPGAAGA